MRTRLATCSVFKNECTVPCFPRALKVSPKCEEGGCAFLVTRFMRDVKVRPSVKPMRTCEHVECCKTSSHWPKPSLTRFVFVGFVLPLRGEQALMVMLQYSHGLLQPAPCCLWTPKRGGRRCCCPPLVTHNNFILAESQHGACSGRILVLRSNCWKTANLVLLCCQNEIRTTSPTARLYLHE